MAVACRGGVPHACRGEELDGSVEVLLWRVQVAVADHAAGVAHAEVVADDRIVLVGAGRVGRESKFARGRNSGQQSPKKCRPALSNFTYGHLRTTLTATTRDVRHQF